jgi:hypothetical protein
VAGKQGILAREDHCPFILPMSVKSERFIIVGTRISGRKSAYGG